MVCAMTSSQKGCCEEGRARSYLSLYSVRWMNLWVFRLKPNIRLWNWTPDFSLAFFYLSLITCLILISFYPKIGRGEEPPDSVRPAALEEMPELPPAEGTVPPSVPAEAPALPPTEGTILRPVPVEAPALPPVEGTMQPSVPAEAPVLPPAEGTIPPSAPAEAPALPPAEGTAPPVVMEGVVPPPPSRGFLTWLREEVLKDIELRGYLKNETAYRYVSPTAFSKILNILQVEPSYSFTQNIKWSARVWAYYDLAYDLQDLGTIAPMKPFAFIQPPDPGEPEPDIENLRDIRVDQYGIDLKEFYFDIFFRDVDLRIGKQIIRWGIVEGWRILDEVNPLDFKEHILRDVADRYIPLWIVKGDYYLGPLTIEGIWTPDVKGHEPAPLRSEWSQFQKLPNLQRVPRNFKNSEGGLRVSGNLGGYEFALAYFTQWDDFPTAFRSVSGLGLGNLGISPEVVFFPRYRRLYQYGAGLAKSLGKIVLEGEFAYVDGKWWGTCTACGTDEAVFNEIQRDYIKHVVGVKTVLYGTDISLNFSQDIILNHTPDIQQSRHEDAASLFARKEIRYGTMVPQLLAISLMNRKEYLFRPKLEYRYTDRITFLFGADIFSGDPGPDPGRLNFFGYFDDDDRMYMEVKYSF